MHRTVAPGGAADRERPEPNLGASGAPRRGLVRAQGAPESSGISPPVVAAILFGSGLLVAGVVVALFTGLNWKIDLSYKGVGPVR